MLNNVEQYFKIIYQLFVSHFLNLQDSPKPSKLINIDNLQKEGKVCLQTYLAIGLLLDEALFFSTLIS